MKYSSLGRAVCLMVVASLMASGAASVLMPMESAAAVAAPHRAGTLREAIGGDAAEGPATLPDQTSQAQVLAGITAGEADADAVDAQVAASGLSAQGVAPLATDLIVTRIMGANRFATVAEAVDRSFSSAEVAVIVSGEQTYDCGFASGLAGVFDAPVLATTSSLLPADTRNALVDLGVTKVFLIGDTSVIGSPVQTAIEDLGIATERIGGATATARAANVAQRMKAELGAAMPDSVIVVDEWRGAVLAGPISWARHIPILIVDNVSAGDCSVPPETASMLDSLDVSEILVLWSGRLSELDAIHSGLSEWVFPAVIAHEDPGVLSVRFAEACAYRGWIGSWSLAGIINGDATGPYEALGAGAALGAQGAPALFTRPERLSYVVDRFLYDSAAHLTDVWLFGGLTALAPTIDAAAADQSEPVPPLPPGAHAVPGNRLVLVMCEETTDVVDAEYRFWRASSQFGTYAPMISSDDPFWWDTPLANGTTYWYKVSVVDAARGIEGPMSPPLSAQPVPATPQRVSGTDRYQTAIAISRYNFTETGSAVIATGADYPDALAASGLCGLYDAPLLLTPANSLPPGLLGELERLGVWRVFLAGGTSVISTSVENALRSAGYSVTRFAGKNRYDTAALIARHVLARNGSPEVFVVRGDDFADALAVSPWAYWYQVPVLLVQPDAIPPETSSVFWDRHIEFAVVAGGPNAILDRVAARLMVDEGIRIYGSNRYTTAIALEQILGAPYRPYFALGVATGTNFADALGGGVACGSWASPLILTSPSGLVPEARTLVDSTEPTVQLVEVYGGAVALPESIVTEVRNLLR
ncbi:cell wall-binding repeat-containing protein [Anaerosoma tenue]|uniref:cell wall-binding repeat-containing protein n=1 Tax=Anaerosoma tenue TaxID=2933588 RepID=UPI002260EA6C|nr:cell wall-binding repeat-containing protein [Anaerosoma tenue]MCK8115134.1 cell wall-binding repeat-containing protein [Anaerosoma tenue]